MFTISKVQRAFGPIGIASTRRNVYCGMHSALQYPLAYGIFRIASLSLHSSSPSLSPAGLIVKSPNYFFKMDTSLLLLLKRFIITKLSTP